MFSTFTAGPGASAEAEVKAFGAADALAAALSLAGGTSGAFGAAALSEEGGRAAVEGPSGALCAASEAALAGGGPLLSAGPAADGPDGSCLFPAENARYRR
jgi:hypothetical protein